MSETTKIGGLSVKFYESSKESFASTNEYLDSLLAKYGKTKPTAAPAGFYPPPHNQPPPYYLPHHEGRAGYGFAPPPSNLYGAPPPFGSEGSYQNYQGGSGMTMPQLSPHSHYGYGAVPGVAASSSPGSDTGGGNIGMVEKLKQLEQLRANILQGTSRAHTAALTPEESLESSKMASQATGPPSPPPETLPTAAPPSALPPPAPWSSNRAAHASSYSPPAALLSNQRPRRTRGGSTGSAQTSRAVSPTSTRPQSPTSRRLSSDGVPPPSAPAFAVRSRPRRLGSSGGTSAAPSPMPSRPESPRACSEEGKGGARAREPPEADDEENKGGADPEAMQTVCKELEKSPVLVGGTPGRRSLMAVEHAEEVVAESEAKTAKPRPPRPMSSGRQTVAPATTSATAAGPASAEGEPREPEGEREWEDSPAEREEIPGEGQGGLWHEGIEAASPADLTISGEDAEDAETSFNASGFTDAPLLGTVNLTEEDADAGEGGESSLSGGVNGDLGLMVLIPGEDDCADEEVEGGIDGVEGRLMELLGGGEEEDTKDSGGKEGNKREEAGADGGEAMASHTEEEGGNSGPLNWGKGTESLDDSMPLRGSPRGSTLPADAGATAFDLEDGGWEEDRRREDEAGAPGMDTAEEQEKEKAMLMYKYYTQGMESQKQKQTSASSFALGVPDPQGRWASRPPPKKPVYTPEIYLGFNSKYNLENQSRRDPRSSETSRRSSRSAYAPENPGQVVPRSSSRRMASAPTKRSPSDLHLRPPRPFSSGPERSAEQKHAAVQDFAGGSSAGGSDRARNTSRPPSAAVRDLFKDEPVPLFAVTLSRAPRAKPKRRPASAYATATHAAALGLQPKEVTECRRRAKETAQRRCASASGVRSRKVLISLTPEPSTDSLADGTPFNEACARLEKEVGTTISTLEERKAEAQELKFGSALSNLLGARNIREAMDVMGGPPISQRRRREPTGREVATGRTKPAGTRGESSASGSNFTDEPSSSQREQVGRQEGRQRSCSARSSRPNQSPPTAPRTGAQAPQQEGIAQQRPESAVAVPCHAKSTRKTEGEGQPPKERLQAWGTVKRSDADKGEEVQRRQRLAQCGPSNLHQTVDDISEGEYLGIASPHSGSTKKQVNSANDRPPPKKPSATRGVTQTPRAASRQMKDVNRIAEKWRLDEEGAKFNKIEAWQMDLDAETMRAVREAVGDEEALASKNLRERGASRAVRHTWWGGVREEDAERQKFQRAGRIGLKTTQALKALKSSKRLLHPVEYENILLAEEAAGGAYSQWGGEEA